MNPHPPVMMTLLRKGAVLGECAGVASAQERTVATTRSA